tara:strand:+ start:5030 stop:5164 length:135 start_codon:yes stop_codon:yes gene_type:complete
MQPRPALLETPGFGLLDCFMLNYAAAVCAAKCGELAFCGAGIGD